MEAMPQTMPKAPKTRGRLWSGMVKEMMTRAPEKMPATPMPAMARPTMRTVLDGATAQMSEPSSKMQTAVRKPHFTCHSVRVILVIE